MVGPNLLACALFFLTILVAPRRPIQPNDKRDNKVITMSTTSTDFPKTSSSSWTPWQTSCTGDIVVFVDPAITTTLSNSFVTTFRSTHEFSCAAGTLVPWIENTTSQVITTQAQESDFHSDTTIYTTCMNTFVKSARTDSTLSGVVVVPTHHNALARFYILPTSTTVTGWVSSDHLGIQQCTFVPTFATLSSVSVTISDDSDTPSNTAATTTVPSLDGDVTVTVRTSLDTVTVTIDGDSSTTSTPLATVPSTSSVQAPFTPKKRNCVISS